MKAQDFKARVELFRRAFIGDATYLKVIERLKGVDLTNIRVKEAHWIVEFLATWGRLGQLGASVWRNYLEKSGSWLMR